jgi:hypothetical protein
MVTLLNLNATAPLLAARPVRPPGAPPAERAPGAVQTAATARALAERGERTLARYLPLHDTGSWSLYGLMTPGHPWRGFPADVGYHCYHIRLLRQLAPLAPGRGFAVVADRWAAYAALARVRCRP